MRDDHEPKEANHIVIAKDDKGAEFWKIQMVPVQSTIVNRGNSTKVFKVLEGVASDCQNVIDVVEFWFVP